MAIVKKKGDHVPRKVVDADLTLRYCTYVKNAMILVLREAFSHEATPEEYRYNKEDKEKRQLSIYRAFPKRVTKYPAIIVSTSVGDASITTLGTEAGYELRDPITDEVTGVVHTGTMYLPVNITILAETATDRERLTDLVTIYTRYIFKGVFEREQMPFLDIEAGEEGEDTTDNIVIYKGRVSLRVQTEFDQFLDQTLLDAVRSVDIKGLLFGTKESDMQPNQTEPEI